MKYALPIAVLMFMLSVGMSLKPGQLLENWRRLTPSLWARLLAATFFVPPFLALTLGLLLPLGSAATAVFLIAVAPGAPLMTRGVAKKGFDMQIAASYQVWGALFTPVFIPLLVAFGGWVYGRDIWVPPMKLVAMVFKMGSTLSKVSPWVALAALLLATGCLMAVRVLLYRRSPAVQTLAIANANRHVGLALLLAGQQIHDQRPVPAIAAYALAAVLVMGFYAEFAVRNMGDLTEAQPAISPTRRARS
jgi:hypothetical protein